MFFRPWSFSYQENVGDRYLGWTFICYVIGHVKSGDFFRICSTGCCMLYWILRLWVRVRSKTLMHLFFVYDFRYWKFLLSVICLFLLHFNSWRRMSNPHSLHKNWYAAAFSHWQRQSQLLIVMSNFWLGIFRTWRFGWLGN